MQLLYVTEFSVAAAQDGDLAAGGKSPVEGAVDATLAELAEWAGSPAGAITVPNLLSDGFRKAEATPHGTSKHAEWTHLRVDHGTWVTRLDVVTTGADAPEFTARTSVGAISGALRLRIGLSRELHEPTAGLTPVADPVVRQPRFLTALVQRKGLRVSCDGQVVDGRFLQARGSQMAAVVAQSLRQRNRLPILLVHSRTKPAHAGVHGAAAGLVGLVTVVTLDLPTARHLLKLDPRVRVPYEGALLIWSGEEVPTTTVHRDIVNADDPDVLRTWVMQQVAPLSALTRGSDEVYRSVREIVRSARADEVAAQTAAAIATGDQEAVIAALTEQRDQALRDEKYAVEEWTKADQRAQDRAAEAARWKATAEQLQVANDYAPAAVIDDPDGPTFENVPTLRSKDAASLEQVCEHLERAAEGRIVFTPAAHAAWRKTAKYPTPDLMRTALTKLAQVAHDLYDGQDRTMAHTDIWIRETYDLKVSLQDDTMSKSFRSFVFEGTTYDRTPHVQVNDGVPRHECGRIYFAFDKRNGRLVVDHVGLHH